MAVPDRTRSGGHGAGRGTASRRAAAVAAHRPLGGPASLPLRLRVEPVAGPGRRLVRTPVRDNPGSVRSTSQTRTDGRPDGSCWRSNRTAPASTPGPPARPTSASPASSVHGVAGTRRRHGSPGRRAGRRAPGRRGPRALPDAGHLPGPLVVHLVLTVPAAVRGRFRPWRWTASGRRSRTVGPSLPGSARNRLGHETITGTARSRKGQPARDCLSGSTPAVSPEPQENNPQVNSDRIFGIAPADYGDYYR